MEGTGLKKTPPRAKPGEYQQRNPKDYQFLRHKVPCLKCEDRRRLPKEEQVHFKIVDVPERKPMYQPKVFVSIFAGRKVWFCFYLILA